METIVLVTDAWHPQINGVVTTLTHTVDFLRRQGHRVITITPESFPSIPCPSYREIRLALTTRRRIARELEKIRPTCVHIATEGPLGWAARAVCRRKKFAFTSSYHTRFPEYLQMRRFAPLSLSYKVVRSFHNAAAATMVGTETLMNELAGRGFTGLARWSRGVDTDLFKPENSKVPMNLDSPVFVYVGRVAVEKNIEAFLQLQLPGSKMVIGDGPAREALEKAYPQVHFTGYLHGAELVHALNRCDVSVFPSRTDTFGVVILEAMAVGLPVAAYPVTGPMESIKNGENGWMDEDLRYAALQALKVKPVQCRRYAMNHTWDRCGEMFERNLAFQRAMQ